MKSPRRRLTTRAMLVVTALFALDFGAIAWVVRQQPDGPRVGNQVLRGDVWVHVTPISDLIVPVVFFAPFLLLFALIYCYVPPRLDEVFTVVLILVLLLTLIIPALRHS
jgi:hypothetical protein